MITLQKEKEKAKKMMLSNKDLMERYNRKLAEKGVQLAPSGTSTYCSIILKLETVEKLKDLSMSSLGEGNVKTFDKLIMDLIKEHEDKSKPTERQI